MTNCQNENGRVKVDWSPEGAGQNYPAGAALKRSSGKLIAASNGETDKIAGFSKLEASGKTDTDTCFETSTFSNEFELPVYHATPANAKTAITDCGAKYGLAVIDGIPYVNKGDTVNQMFHVQRLSEKDPVGKTNGRLWVKILSDMSEYGPGEKTA